MTDTTTLSPGTTALSIDEADTVRPVRRRRPSPGRVLAWAALLVVLLITLFPFYWVLRTALSTNADLPSAAGNLLPVGLTLDNFARVLGMAPTTTGDGTGTLDFWLYLRNSLIVSTLITLGQVFFSAMAAYAFARLRWPGRDQVFFVFLTALMIPPVFVTLPNFVLIKHLGLLNTYAAMVLPYFFMTPFAVFFLRQFFLGISREVEESAMLDGAGHARIFLRLILPMSRTPVITLGMLTYITAWSDYFWPLLVGSDNSVRPLTVALGIFQAQSPQTGPDWAGLMAATLIAALPMLALFLIVGRQVVNNIGYSGIK
jgi:multiple sugar transport system permease protein